VVRGQYARHVRVQAVHVARVQDELGEVAAHLLDAVREQRSGRCSIATRACRAICVGVCEMK
jgi:hypothetical protein